MEKWHKQIVLSVFVWILTLLVVFFSQGHRQ